MLVHTLENYHASHYITFNKYLEYDQTETNLRPSKSKRSIAIKPNDSSHVASFFMLALMSAEIITLQLSH